MRKLIITSLLSFTLVGSAVVSALPQSALAEPSASQETLDKLANAEARYQEAQNKLADISARVEQAGEDLAQTQEDIAATQTAIEEKEAEIKVKEEELAAAQEVLGERINANYRAGQMNFLEVLLNSENLNDFLTRTYYMSKISERDNESIQLVKDLREELKTQKAALDARKAELVELEKKQQAEKERLDAAQAEAQTVLNNLDAEVKELMAKKAAEIEAAKEAERQAAIERARQAELEAQQNANRSSGGGSSATGRTRVNAVASPDIVANAMQYLGCAYVWGATGPNTFDCSGLTMTAYRQAGKSIPRTSRAQHAAVKAAGNMTYDAGSLVPGDMVFFGSPVHHVGIYIGGGKYVHAPQSGDVVKVSTLGSFNGGGHL